MGHDYSLSDIAAMNGNNRGGFGNGADMWGWLIILLLFGWGGRGGFGGYGGAGLQGMATRADINEGFALNGITTGITAIQQGICDSTYALNNAITSGFYGVVIDITDDTLIVEFGSNKNCRIPMKKAAIAQIEKANADN